jgi:hypothetical protein
MLKNGLFSALIDNRGNLTDLEFAAATQFKARFNFADQLEAIKTEGIEDETSDSYFALLKLGLAYSAVEALHELMGPSRKVKISDHQFQEAISAGEFSDLVSHLAKRASQNKRDNSAELVPFQGQDCPNDLLVLVKHSRHVVFHGAVTPATVKLAQSQKRRKLLLGLAKSTLSACEIHFEKWLREVLAKRLAKF